MNAISSPPASSERGRIIGRAHEDRFERIMTDSPRLFPSWYQGIRRATEEEDRHGIDFVIELDVAEVTLQIKSSVKAREKHIAEHHRHCGTHEYKIPVVIVCDAFSDEVIKAQTMRVLSVARERFFHGGRFSHGSR